jgi:hypothetical protein
MEGRMHVVAVLSIAAGVVCLGAVGIQWLMGTPSGAAFRQLCTHTFTVLIIIGVVVALFVGWVMLTPDALHRPLAAISLSDVGIVIAWLAAIPIAYAIFIGWAASQ